MKQFSPQELVVACFSRVLILLLLITATQTANAQTCSTPSYNLDQGRNGNASNPVNPVAWANGNLNASQSHFVEGYSVPYRAIISGLISGQCYCIQIEWDIRHSSVNALDYITSYPNCTNSLCDDPSHLGSFMHGPECVDPLIGAGLVSPTMSTFPIPAPTNNILALGNLQPVTSFNSQEPNEKLLTMWNGTLTSAAYNIQGSLTASQSATSMIICFTATNTTAVLAWGGHIASRLEWGVGNSAGAISGSPYHMRVIGSRCCSNPTFSGGNQDRSLQAAAVIPAPIAFITGTDTSCVGGLNNHMLTTNQPGESTYSWNIASQGTTGALIVGSNTTQSIQVSTTGPGEYIICGTITINGVSGSTCDTITVFELPVCSITGDAIVCNGASTTFTASGGDSYLWSTGETTQSIQVDVSDTYTVTITDIYGCSSSCDKSLTAGAPFSLDLDVTDVFCKGQSTGSINLNVIGGGVGLVYSWSNGASSEDISGLIAGTYTVTVTDINGCSVTGSATITEPAADLTIDETHLNISCKNGSDGSIDLTVSGGTAPYTYSWSNASTDEDLTALTAGNYNVLVTDFFGCTATESILLTEPDAIVINEQHTNVACNGGNDGSIDLSVSGGTGAYSYLWNDNDVNEDRSGLSAGTYTVTVTDANLCTAVKNVSISQAGTLLVQKTHDDVSCKNGSDGAIDISVSGGTPGYDYLWNDNETTQDRTGLLADTYTITVTDANGCSAIETIVVTEPPLLTVSEQHGNVTCFNLNNGSINITVNGGTGPYTFDWNTGFSSDEDLSGLASGNYEVIVTDANSCTAAKSVFISQPDELVISNAVVDDVLCKNGNTGSIDISVAGGTLDYIFSWNNGSSNEDISNLTAGNYDVTIMDANSCTVTGQYTINEPDLLQVTETNVDILCFDDANGSIDLTVIGGTPTYSYEWSSGATSEDISGLVPATYTVTVTDANGCTASLIAEITEPTELTLMELHENETCNESNNGSINLGVMGGTPTYTYNWSNGAITEDISGLEAGTYTVIVTDANSCSKTLTVPITQPDLLSLETIPTHVLCNGALTGAIDLTASGGTGAYGYEWSNTATSEDISALAAGTYTVTVTDANGCTATTSETITEPIALNLSAQVTDSQCGGASGSIDLTVTGGTVAYSYEWSNTAATEDISGLSAGTYTVTVTDANGCSDTQSWMVQDAGAVSANAVDTDASCNGGADGSADLTVSGGTPAYSYSWSNGETTEDISGLIAGTYTVTVTDANGCVANTSVTIGEPDAIIVEASGYCSPCKKKDEAYATAVASGGTGILTYLWSNGETTTTITNLASGIYTVTVTDANGCFVESQVTLDCDPKCQYTTFTIGGYGSVPAGNNPGVYVHANFASAFPNGLTIGCDNTLQLTSAQAVTDFLPSGSTPSVLPIGSLVNPGQGYSNVLSAQLVAATLSIGFDLNDPAFSPELSNLADQFIATGVFAGWTVSQLIDSANHFIGGCGSLYSASQFNAALTALNENFDNGTVNLGYIVCPSEELDAYIIKSDIPCDKQCEGSATVVALEGTAPYSYLWSTGAITATVNNLCEGTYTVTVTDANGCVVVREVEIIQINVQIDLTFDINNIACHGSATGTIDINIAGGASPYSYLWSNGETTAGIGNLVAGTYTVTVTDANGCTGTGSASVSEPDPLQGNITGTNILCAKKDDGSADLTVWGGTEPYSFLWSNGETTEDISGLTPGTYTVTITDANDCILVLDVEITETSTWMNLYFENTHTMCAGATTGVIDLEIDGGVAPYTYLWSNGETTQDISGLIAGFYQVTVTDANGCSNSVTTYISGPSPIQLSASKVNPVCGLNGSVNLHVSGGVSPYTYLWSNGETTQDISGLIPGMYTVTVTDANGCTASLWKKLWGAKAMKIRKKSITHTSDLVCDGAIDIKVWGGHQPLTYQWSNGAVTEDISNLCAGVYKVTVTDAKGCTVSKALRVKYLKDVIPVRLIDTGAQESQVTLVSIYPNPASTSATMQLKFNTGEQASIQIYGRTGELIDSYQNIDVEPGVTMEVELDVSEFASGTYIIAVMQNGRVVHGKIHVMK